MAELYQKCIDRLVEEYTAGDFFREVYDAKKDFFDNLGVINEDDSDFENQMDIFMGWYLFDRPLRDYDLAPVQLYYRKHLDALPEEDRLRFKELTETRHSVYELLKLSDKGIVLRDLSNKSKLEVVESPFKVGFSKGDIFEARLIPHGTRYCFASGFCFHPKEAFRFIEEQMKKIRLEDHAQRTKTLLKLSQMKYKHQRFPHIDVSYIYTLTPKF